MKKILLTFIIFLFVFLKIYADETSDDLSIQDETSDVSIEKKIKLRDRNNYFMKFRGEIQFVLTYLFPYQDGVYQPNHFSPVTYDTLDYTDESDSNNDHHSKGDDGRIIGKAGTEFKIYSKYHFIAPFFTLNNPLMKDNNIKFSVLAEISPVTFNAGLMVTITPVAFLSFESGFMLGNGWTLSSEWLSGMGINDDGDIQRPAAEGPLMQVWFAPTFMFDLAYVLPKKFQKWTHIVAIAKPVFKYQSLLSINNNQPYMLEEDPGENLNGWKLQGEYILGYRYYVIEDESGKDNMFIKMRNKEFIITAGCYLLIDMLNLSHYNDSPMKDGWGSDFTVFYLGPALQFDFPYNFFLKLFFLFKSDRSYTSETVGNKSFQDREYLDWNMSFRRIGFFFGWNF